MPLIISMPGTVQAGRVSDALVELLDLTPTLLEVAGLEIPQRMQGRSLMPILTGQADDRAHREFVRAEYYSALNSDVPGREEFTGMYATMLRTRTHKIVNYHGLDVGELFDLETDPREHNNLWDDPGSADLRFRLMQRNFDALARAVDPGTRQILYY